MSLLGQLPNEADEPLVPARSQMLVYATSAELDRATGAAVNESEFVRALLANDLCEVRVVACYRSSPPADFHDPRITWVRSHGGGVRGLPGFWWRMSRAIERSIHASSVTRTVLLMRLPAVPVVEALLVRRLCRQKGPRIAIKTLIDPAAMLRRKLGIFARPAIALSRWLTSQVLRRAMCIDTVSPVWAQWLRETYSQAAGKIRVVSNGANIDYFSPVSTTPRELSSRISRRARLLFAGTLQSYFSLDRLLEAVARIAPSERNFEIVIAGTGPLELQLRDQVARHGLASWVHFLGWIEYEGLARAMAACDWGIDLTRVDVRIGGVAVPTSFSQKMAQYLAAGLPVLGWDIDGNEFVREEGLGLLAAIDDIESLSRALRSAAAMVHASDFDAARGRCRKYVVQQRSQAAVVARRLGLYGWQCQRVEPVEREDGALTNLVPLAAGLE